MLFVLLGLNAQAAAQRDFYVSHTYGLGFQATDTSIRQTSQFSIHANSAAFDPSTIQISDDATWLEAVLDPATRLVSVTVDAEFGIPVQPDSNYSQATITVQNASGSATVDVKLFWYLLSNIVQIYPPDDATGRFAARTYGALLVFDAQARPLKGWSLLNPSLFPPFPGSSLRHGTAYPGKSITLDLEALTLEMGAIPSSLAPSGYSGITNAAPGPDGLFYLRTYDQPGVLQAYDPVRNELTATYSIPEFASGTHFPFRLAQAPFPARLDLNVSAINTVPRNLLASLPMVGTASEAWEFGPAATVPLPPGLGAGHAFVSNQTGTVFAQGAALWRETAAGPVLLRTFDPDEDSLVRAISPDGHLYATNREVRATEDDRLVLSLPRDAYYKTFPKVHAFNADGRGLVVTSTSTPRSPYLVTLADPASPAPAPLRFPVDGAALLDGDALRWGAVPGATAYQLRLGSDAEETLPLAQTTAATESRPAGLSPGLIYRWRVDAILDGLPVRGAEQTFVYRTAILDDLPSRVGVLPGLANQSHRFAIRVSAADTAWSLASDQPWLGLSATTGQGPASVTLSIDASALSSSSTPLLAHLSLVTADSAEDHDLAIIPVAPDFVALQLIPGTARALALNRVADAPNQLVEVDLATGTRLRAATVGEAETLAISSDGAHVFTLDHVANKITLRPLPALTPVDASIALPYPLRGGPSSTASAMSAAARRLGPAGPGRFAFYQDGLAQILDVDGHLLAENRTTFAAHGFSPDGRFYFEGDLTSGFWQIQRRSVFPPSPFPNSRNLTGAPYARNGSLVLTPSADGSLVYFDGLTCDADLAQVGSRGDAITSLAPDDSVRFGRHLAYRASAPEAPLQLPAHRAIPILAPSIETLGFITPEGDLGYASLNSLPAAPRAKAKILTLTSYTLSFTIDDPAAYPAGTTYRFQYRPVNGDGAWRVADAREANTVGVLNPLSAKTDYQLRIQAYQGSSAITDWSEPLPVRTLIAPPSLPYRADQLPVQPGAMIDTIIQVDGENTTVSLTNLPPGLHYDQETRRLTGVFFPDGKATQHSATLSVSNAGGSFTKPFTIYLRSVGDALKPAGTYQGLIDSERNHLVGSWRVTFTGDKLTGLYRGVLGDISFSGRLVQAPSPGLYTPAPAPYFYFERKLSAQDTLYFRLEWHKGQNRATLSVNETGHYNEAEGETTRFTGYPSTWPDSYPPASLSEVGTHTALLLPDDTDSYILSPRPYGVGFFRVKATADGRAVITGETATGQLFTQSSQISNVRVMPLFARLGAHTHWAQLRFDSVSPQIPSLSGDWRWEATPAASAANPYGIREALTVVGAALPDAANLNPLANPYGHPELHLSGGGLSRLPTAPRQVVFTDPSGFSVPAAGSAKNPQRFALSLAPATGLLTGSATLADPIKTPAVQRTVKLRGQFVKNPLHDGRDLVGGYLLFPDAKGLPQSSRLEITEPVATDSIAPTFAASSRLQDRSSSYMSSGSLNNATIPPPINLSAPETSKVVADQNSISTATVLGSLAHAKTLRLTAAPEVAWTLSSNQTWLVPSLAAGTGSAEVALDFYPAPLPRGTHSAQLTLGDGTVSTTISVTLTVEALGIFKLADDPTSARAYALSRESWNSANAHLLKIDANDGRILRTAQIPATATELAVHAGDALLYLADETQKSISARALDSLEPVRTFSFATLPDGTPSPDNRAPKRILPGRAGRLLAEFAGPYSNYGALRWLDTADGRIVATREATTGSVLALHASTNRLFHYGRIPADYYLVGLVEFDLSVDTFATVVGITPNLGSAATGFLPPGPEPRLYVGTAIYNRNLADRGPAPEPIIAASPDENILVARHVAYVGGEMRSLPPATLRVYNTTSARIVSADTTTIKISDPVSLPPALPVTLTATEIGDNWVRLSWSGLPPDIYPYAEVVLQSRPIVGDSLWQDRYVYSGYAQNGSLNIAGNTPESTVEFRLRFRHEDGYYQPFNQPITVTFLTPRPAAPSSSHLLDMHLGVEGSAPVPFTGAGLEYNVEDLPPGLSFDSANQSIVGTPLIPGRYKIKITATNVAGSVTQEFSLTVRTDTAKARGAHYTGLLDLDGGSLTGIWSATRSLDQITGTYRTALFSRPFKASLRTSDGTGFSKAVAKISYDRVPIYLTIEWDPATDRLALHAETFDLVENFSAVTTEETGLPSHWWGSTLPCPHAGRHTALLIPGEGNGSRLPEGSGLMRLDITTDGEVAITGETPLGQLFTQSTYLSDFHSLPIFHFNKDTLALGGVELPAPAEDAPRLVGVLAWAKDTNRKASSYPGGFEQELLVVGGPLPATGKNLPPLLPLANSTGTAHFILADGGLDRLSKPVRQILATTATGLAAPEAGSPENPNRVAVKLDSATGIVTGSVTLLDDAGKKALRDVKFRGILLKDPLRDGEDVIGGYFLFPDTRGVLESGRLEVTEPDADEPGE